MPAPKLEGHADDVPSGSSAAPAAGCPDMTVRLRGHHLLCLLTYAGKGYSPAFVANLDRVAARLGAGEAALVVEGPDDICAPMLPAGNCHCLMPRVRRRDGLALDSVSGLLGRPVAPGVTLVLGAAVLDRLRAGFASGGIRPACAGCAWSRICTGIAASGYGAARLAARPPSS